MRRWIVASLAVASLLSASAASADDLSGRRDLQAYTERARAFWHDSSCRHVRYLREEPPGEPAGQTDWWASAERGGCSSGSGTVYLTPDQPVLKLGGLLAPRYACTIVVREYGTLLGFGPSEDPANIMFAGASYPDGSFIAAIHRFPKACRRP